jgi:hypothetical protein
MSESEKSEAQQMIREAVRPFEEKMNELYAHDLPTDVVIANGDKAIALAQQFQATHADYDQYALFHVLTGSYSYDKIKLDTDDGKLAKIINSL